MALLVALALLVAQTVSAGLLLKERHERRLNTISAPLVARIVDAEERLNADGTDNLRRSGFLGRARIADMPAVTPELRRMTDFERRISVRLGNIPLNVADVRVAQAGREDVRAWVPRRRAERAPRDAEFVLVSVQLENGLWINLVGIEPRIEKGLLDQILLRTAIIYLVVLLSVLWLGRRAAKSLNHLTHAVANVGLAPDTADASELRPRGPVDVQRLTTAFLEMRDRISGMLLEKDRMIGAIGHDLRTPLASLRLRAEMVEDPDTRAAMVDTIAEMDATLEDILALARLRQSAEDIQTVDVAALVDAVTEDFRALGLDVIFEPGARVTAPVRPVLMRRAIRNLIDNAVTYGGRARVSVFRQNQWVVVDIRDEGPGIANADMERVFEDFVRLEHSRNRQTGGSGLGLTLAREIIAGEGGELELRNRKEGGLQVLVRLPVPSSPD